ncbi:WYL domain-containing protein [Streptosporangium sp. NPDC051023]|uniref:helix-turn-helix transcriptional regulator n=1 Tax=Streptosporangium sp. NPDC051023 TaxID=3155410 RepID=UPI00344FCE3E
MRERFHLDVPGWYRDADETPFLGDVAEAVWEQRPMRMTYRRWGPRDVERLTHPYGLVLKGGTWYLVATADGGGPRTYRVSRIVTAEILDGRFDRPADFDLSAYWESYAADFRTRMHTGEALVRVAPGVEKMLRYTVGAEIVDAAMAEAGPPDERGWTVIRLPTESTRHAHWLLLRLGADVEVLEPPELRALMAATAAGLSELYRTPQERDTGEAK